MLRSYQSAWAASARMNCIVCSFQYQTKVRRTYLFKMLVYQRYKEIIPRKLNKQQAKCQYTRTYLPRINICDKNIIKIHELNEIIKLYFTSLANGRRRKTAASMAFSIFSSRQFSESKFFF